MFLSFNAIILLSLLWRLQCVFNLSEWQSIISSFLLKIDIFSFVWHFFILSLTCYHLKVFIELKYFILP